MKINLDKMCFTEFVEYLEEKNISYTVTKKTVIDTWFEDITVVTPSTSTLKPRYFEEGFFDDDGGTQLTNQPNG